MIKKEKKFIPETQIRSVADLINHIKYLQSELSSILWFRGQRDSSWDLSPKVYRDSHSSQERNYTHRFTARAGTRLLHRPQDDQKGIWLSLMQHYGLPTRLLDWSRSPLVAAYFAIEEFLYSLNNAVDSENIDAAICVLLPHYLNEREHNADITPNISAKMCSPLILPAFFHEAPKTEEVMAVMAVEHDLRMFTQQGCFTLHSDKRPFNTRKNSHDYLRKITIPHEAIPNFAKEIAICGFRKGDIYPDLGNLALELSISKGL